MFFEYVEQSVDEFVELYESISRESPNFWRLSSKVDGKELINQI